MKGGVEMNTDTPCPTTWARHISARTWVTAEVAPALHDVEHSAETGASGREEVWRGDLRGTLVGLASALQEQLGNALASDGLYSDIERDCRV